MEKPIVIDFVTGRIGTFVKFENSKLSVLRKDIIMRPFGVEGLFKKEKIMNVPEKGIVPIPASELNTPFDWYLILTYGDDNAFPPIITRFINKRFDELTSKLEEMSKTISLKTRMVEGKKRLMERDINDELEKKIKILKKITSRTESERIRGSVPPIFGGE